MMIHSLVKINFSCKCQFTRPVDRISRRKLRDTKEQLMLKHDLVVLGCCLVSKYFPNNPLFKGHCTIQPEYCHLVSLW